MEMLDSRVHPVARSRTPQIMDDPPRCDLRAVAKAMRVRETIYRIAVIWPADDDPKTRTLARTTALRARCPSAFLSTPRTR